MKVLILATIVALGLAIGFENLLKILFFIVVSVIGIPLSILLGLLIVVVLFTKKDKSVD